MPYRQTKTKGISTEWMMEVFDWDTPIPVDNGTGGGAIQNLSKFKGALGDGGNTSAKAYFNANILTSFTSNDAFGAAGKDPFSGMKKAVIEDILRNYSPQDRASGLISVNFTREKTNIERDCIVNMVGALQSHTRSGNWVLLSTIENTNRYGPRPVIKFIGQIGTIESNFDVLSNGNVVSRHTVYIMPWTSLLTTPISFDLRSAVGIDPNPDTFNKIGSISNDLIKRNGGEKSYQNILDVAKLVENPYGTAEYYMALVGLLNSDAFTGKIPSSLYSVALSMPILPEDLLMRLGMSSVDSKSPFATGFVKVITGRQKGENLGLNKGDWNGFFNNSSKFSSFTLAQKGISPATSVDDYVKSYDKFGGDTENQPVKAGQVGLAQLGKVSVWQMITAYCDPMLNETYADILYQEDDGITSAVPVVFVRGKPWRTKAAEEMAKMSSGDKKGIYGTWDRFEDLPRIRIDNELILGISVKNSIKNSPNYFMCGFSQGDTALVASGIQQYASFFAARNNAEMVRFGGSAITTQSQYIFTGDAKTTDWAKTQLMLARVWYGYDYRTASGSLKIKDPGIPLTLGFNIQFSIPMPDLTTVDVVAQIESVSTNFVITPRGEKMTFSTIGFSRMMRVKKSVPFEISTDLDYSNKSDLEFFDPGFFGDIYEINKKGKAEDTKIDSNSIPGSMTS